MRIHLVQHVAYEGPANIEAWAKANGHNFSKSVLYYDEDFPKLKDFDWLFIIGGPMGVYEEKDYPWLKREKAFIKEAIDNKKVVIGICLGAQLIADVLGGKVTKNDNKEIGWFPVKLTPEAKKSVLFKNFPDKFMAFHWHGDTFQIPSGAIKIASSEGCPSQAFEYNGRVIGMQFHLEATDDSINRIMKNNMEDITDGKFIQKPADIRSKTEYLKEINGLMSILFDNILKNCK